MIYLLLGLDLNFYQFIAVALAYIISVIFAMSMHESAHAFVAYKCGDSTAKALNRLTLSPFKHIDPMGFLCFLFIGFGWAKPVPINPSRFKNYRRDMFKVSIAGVAVNFVLAFIFSGIFFFSYQGLAGSTNMFLYFLSNFLYFMVIINLSLCVFNLLPIYPLDGFNVLSSFLKQPNKFLNFMYRYGSIILLIFIITPLFDIVYQFVTGGILNIFMDFWGLFV